MRPSRLVPTIAMILAIVVVASTGCGGDEAPTFEEAFPALTSTAATAVSQPSPVPASPAEEQPLATAVTAPTVEPTATPEPVWQTATVSDGVSFDLPASWAVDDDQASVDAMMESEATVKGLADAGVSGPMDLFGVKVRAVADGPNGERMFYVTVGLSPFPTLGLLSALGEPLVGNFGLDVTAKQEISTDIGTALRVETTLQDEAYLAWIWIEDGQGRIIILTSFDADVERQLVTSLTEQ